jgi:hypothetical protein
MRRSEVLEDSIESDKKCNKRELTEFNDSRATRIEDQFRENQIEDDSREND